MDFGCLFLVTHQHGVNFIGVFEGQGWDIELGSSLQDKEGTLELESSCLDFLILKEAIASFGKLLDHLFLFVLRDVLAVPAPVVLDGAPALGFNVALKFLRILINAESKD